MAGKTYELNPAPLVKDAALRYCLKTAREMAETVRSSLVLSQFRRYRRLAKAQTHL